MQRKRKIALIIGICCIVGGGAFLFRKFKSGPTETILESEFPISEIISVGTGSIEEIVKVSGVTKLANEQTLKFTQPGTIVGVYVKPGEFVAKGQLLAALDKTKVQTQIKEAERALEKAKKKVTDLLAGKKQTEILDAELVYKKALITAQRSDADLIFAHVEKERKIAEAALDLQQVKEKLLLQEKELALQEKEAAIDTDKVTLEKETNTGSFTLSLQEKFASLQADYFSYRSTVETFDRYFGLSFFETNGTIDQDLFFSAKDTKYKAKARQYAQAMYNDLESFSSFLTRAENVPLTKETILDGYEVLSSLCTNAREAGDAMFWAGKASIEAGGDDASSWSSVSSFGESVRASAQTRLSALPADILAIQKIGEISWKDQEYTTSLFQQAKSLRDAQMAYDKAKIALITQEEEYAKLVIDQTRNIEDKELALISAKNDVEKAEEQLEEIKKGYKDDERDDAQIEVEQKENDRENVQKEQENYEIRATFSGIVRTVNMQIGDNLTENNDKSITLENRDYIHVVMDIDQADIGRIQKSMEVRVVFNAFPENMYTGFVLEVDTTPNTDGGDGSQGGGGGGLVTYPVKALLTKQGTGDRIFGQMAVTTDIIISQRNNVLVVPAIAVGYDQTGAYVLLPGKPSSLPRYIEVGMQGGEQIEITSGLSIGQQILSSAFGPSTVESMGIMKDSGEESEGMIVQQVSEG